MYNGKGLICLDIFKLRLLLFEFI